MSDIAIIIPSRLNAKRLPNKPLKLINNKEMIIHVHDLAKKANVGEVIVATPDQKIYDLVRKHGGLAEITEENHETGTDRIFEVFEKKLEKKPKIIINFQGDMPNLNSSEIQDLVTHMKNYECDIGTLASDLKVDKEEKDPNVVKVLVADSLDKKIFSNAIDFFRVSNNRLKNNTYHHVGIYAFTNKALMRYVGLKRSELEIKRKLEQLRALENKMKINVGYIDTCPLSVDTENDLLEIKKVMEIK
jgi:3-deoxy-manno-octulosonate cytidylyltransferase (CMP-KDO synthetase)